jgi:ketosteroid isomerase-like protein
MLEPFPQPMLRKYEPPSFSRTTKVGAPHVPIVGELRMKNGLLGLLAFLTLLSAHQPSLAAKPARDLALEAAVRKADADWAAAANSASVDAWMAFYGADAVVLLPNEELTSDKELLRRSVSDLLALPRLSVIWSPIKVEVVRSGEKALVLDAYELRFGDSRGALMSDRGRRLEIWSKQSDGTWKCMVDTWNLDEPIGAPPAANSESAQGASPANPGAAALASPAPLPPAATSGSGPPSQGGGVVTKFGEMPIHYKEAIRNYFQGHLKYPDSIQYREITDPEQGYTTSVTGSLLMRETRTYGWKVIATISAKNSRDSYAGFKPYTFLFRGEEIVNIRLPLQADEMGEPKPE